jgi:hypothetical protein
MSWQKTGRERSRGAAGRRPATGSSAFDSELAALYSAHSWTASGAQPPEAYADKIPPVVANPRTLTQIERWRSALLGTIAASALMVYGGRPVRADCIGASPTLTCTGTIAGTVSPGVTNGGINVPGGYTTLNVNNLDADIAPDSGVSGISFTAAGDVTIVSDTTDGAVAHAIVATGAGADGIFAISAFGAVTVDSTGDITSDNGNGVAAFASGSQAVSVTNVGAIQAHYSGIVARSDTAAVTVDSTGDVTSDNGDGVVASNTGSEAVSVTNVGAIQGHYSGIVARSDTGAVTIDSTGDITSDNGIGVVAFTSGSQAVSITNVGAIHANFDGILAGSDTGAVTVDSAGDITSTSTNGINAFNSGSQTVSVTSDGTIQANFDGIRAESSSGAVTVDSTGDITSTSTRGIYALNHDSQAVSVTSAGAIQADFDGIAAQSTTGVVTVDSTGDITSDNGKGVVARNSGSQAVSVTSNGTIHANFDGIRAESYAGAVTVDSTGDLTSDNGNGILAFNFGSQAVSVTSAGAIQADFDGIAAQSTTGVVTVDSTGDITSDNGNGVVAHNSGSQAVSVTNVGAIQARYYGILATSGTGTVTVDNTGDITSDNGTGIYASNFGSNAVSVTNNGAIQAHHYGISARSSTGAVTVDSTGAITSGSYGIMGVNGGTAGAGPILITSAGAIHAGSDGILAESSTGDVTVDSTGDVTSDNGRGIVALNYGSDAGPVSVTSAGAIQANSLGIYARSVSGSVTVDSTGDITSDNESGIVASNYSSQAVSVTNAGAIQATRYGILARSATGATTVDSTGDITSTSGRGIYARNNGVGAGPVSVTSAGDIQASSDGIVAKSSDGAVTVDSTGDITSDNGSGIYALNSGSNAISVTNNGAIQAQNDGIFARSATGAVTVDSTGDITSDNGSGLRAFTAGSQAASVTNNGAIQAQNDGIFAESYSGAVTVDSTGDITSDHGNGVIAFTSGSQAASVVNNGAIHAQFNGIVARTRDGTITVDSTGNITSDNGIGIGATNSDWHAVSVTNNGAIHAHYDGIYAQSYSGSVTVDSTGDITSDNGRGIFARSLVGVSATTITNHGNIDAYSTGIYAQATYKGVTVDSTGDVTSQTGVAVKAFAYSFSYSSIDITLRSGTITGAEGGVEFQGGATGTLKNYAAIAGGNFAVRGGPGNETVDNYNLITGNVDLGAGINAFNNRLGGTFRSGANAVLGAGNTLTNAGDLSPGGTGTIQTTVLTGNLVQTGTGSFIVDIDGTSNDLVTITGTANFAGFVAPNVINLSGLTGSAIIASASSLTNTATAIDTELTDFSLRVLGGNELELLWLPARLANLLSGPLTPNQQAMVAYIDALTLAGASPALQGLIDALKWQPSEAAILAALNRLSPEQYLAQVQDTVQANLFFVDSMMSCPNADGRPNFIYEGECYWAKVGGRSSNWDRTTGNIGGDAQAWNVSGGIQVALTDTWRLGFAGSYEHTNLGTNNAASSDGDRGEGGIVLKNRWGDTSFALAAFGGYASFDTSRFIGLDGIDKASGDQGIAFGGAHARVSQLFDQGGWYMKPFVDFDAIYLDYGGFSEHGGGAANLAVHGNSDWVLSARPAIEIGSEIAAGNGAVVRPYLRVGGLFFDNADFAATSDFLSAPAGVSSFTVTSKFDQSYFNVGAGLDVLTLDGMDVKLNYEGLFSGDSDVNSGGLKVGVKF